MNKFDIDRELVYSQRKVSEVAHNSIKDQIQAALLGLFTNSQNGIIITLLIKYKYNRHMKPTDMDSKNESIKNQLKKRLEELTLENKQLLTVDNIINFVSHGKNKFINYFSFNYGLPSHFKNLIKSIAPSFSKFKDLTKDEISYIGQQIDMPPDIIKAAIAHGIDELEYYSRGSETLVYKGVYIEGEKKGEKKGEAVVLKKLPARQLFIEEIA